MPNNSLHYKSYMLLAVLTDGELSLFKDAFHSLKAIITRKFYRYVDMAIDTDPNPPL